MSTQWACTMHTAGMHEAHTGHIVSTLMASPQNPHGISRQEQNASAHEAAVAAERERGQAVQQYEASHRRAAAAEQQVQGVCRAYVGKLHAAC